MLIEPNPPMRRTRMMERPRVQRRLSHRPLSKVIQKAFSTIRKRRNAKLSVWLAKRSTALCLRSSTSVLKRSKKNKKSRKTTIKRQRVP